MMKRRGGPDVDVKRLPKRPAPPQFGRKLTEAQKASFLLLYLLPFQILLLLKKKKTFFHS